MVHLTARKVNMARSKVCFKCNQSKPISEFYKHPKMGDGHLGKCKECTKIDTKTNRNARIDYYRAYDATRAKLPYRIALAIELNRRWRKEDARRSSAHSKVASAVKSGLIKRKPCERCGSVKSMAHHESYDKPLQVTWYCQPCHKRRHKQMAIEGIDP